VLLFPLLMALFIGFLFLFQQGVQIHAVGCGRLLRPWTFSLFSSDD